MSIADDFAKAQEDVKTLTKRPSDQQFLDLYSLFKQATEGDNHTSKPGMFDIKGQFKWNAWKERSGLSREAAMQQYVALVNELLQTHR